MAAYITLVKCQLRLQDKGTVVSFKIMWQQLEGAVIESSHENLVGYKKPT